MLMRNYALDSRLYASDEGVFMQCTLFEFYFTNSSIGAPFQAFLPRNARQMAFYVFQSGRSLALALFLALLFTLPGCSKTPPLPRLAAEATVLAFADRLPFATCATTAWSY